MKKYLIVLALLILGASLWYFWPEETEPVNKAEPIIEAVKDPNTEPCGWVIHQEEMGASMEPTIKAGMKTYRYCIDPKESDIINFRCYTKACMNGRDGKYISLTKRLIKIREDGAWWVEGDNKANSYDSRNYGWILPSERSDVSVVRLQ